MQHNDTYRLNRGLFPSIRLNYQAYLWKEVLGFSLHPLLQSKIQPNSRIADVATGTGIWLCEVSNLPGLAPSVQLDGFDISSENFLNQDQLPSNIKLHYQNFNEQPRAEFYEKFDIVHIRLLLAVVENNDPIPVLDHARKLLKPGGYLQWDEIDPAGNKVLETASKPAPCLQGLANVWRHTVPTRWIPELSNIAEKNGYEVINHSAYTEKLYQRQLLTSLWCMIAEEHATILAQHESTQPKADRIRQLSLGAYQEMRLGSVVSHCIRIMVAKRID